MKIFDCFMYFDEEVILDLRLNILSPYIDYFIIVESSYTHKGDKRNLKFDINYLLLAQENSLIKFAFLYFLKILKPDTLVTSIPLILSKLLSSLVFSAKTVVFQWLYGQQNVLILCGIQSLKTKQETTFSPLITNI